MRALELFLTERVLLPWRSKLSILRTVICVYYELFSEDLIDTLIYMPMYSFSEPDFGSDLFSSPFLNMMRDGVIDFDVAEVDKE